MSSLGCSAGPEDAVGAGGGVVERKSNEVLTGVSEDVLEILKN
jgi:hypothetical protein